MPPVFLSFNQPCISTLFSLIYHESHLHFWLQHSTNTEMLSCYSPTQEIMVTMHWLLHHALLGLLRPNSTFRHILTIKGCVDNSLLKRRKTHRLPQASIRFFFSEVASVFCNCFVWVISMLWFCQSSSIYVVNSQC